MKRRAFLAAIALALGTAPGAGAPLPALPEGAATPASLRPIPVYLVVDGGSGQVLAGRQADLAFVPASMTKVMTAYVAFELIASGRLDPARRMTVSAAVYDRWHGRGTSMGLARGESVSVDDLLQGILTASANDAAAVLAEGYAGDIDRWCALMNAEARRLGMTDSHFATPNGWPDNGATYVSARDLVTLGRALITRHPQRYREYFGRKQMEWHGRTLQSHDPTVGLVPGADGIKTGFTREAGYNFLGSAERDGRRVFIVIGGAKSEAERAVAARELLEWSFSAWDDRELFPRSAKVGAARVQDGEESSVDLLAAAPVRVVVPRGHELGDVRLTLHYMGPLRAPLRKGQQVAELEISGPGSQPGRIPLVTARAVNKAGPLDRVANALKTLFE